MPESLFRRRTETTEVSETTEGSQDTEVSDSDDEKTIVGDDMDLQSANELSNFDDEFSDSDDEPWSGDSDSDLEEDDY